MHLHFLGVRGSTPAPGHEFERYGGNTSAVAVGHDGRPPSLLLDAGTGARRLGSVLGDDPFRGAVLLTHLHWDHIHGLPFSPSLDRPDAEVDLWLPAQDGRSAVELLARGMSPPHFPITPDQLRGRWSFNALEAGTIDVAGFTITALEVPHKGGRTFGYRVDDGRSTVAYLPDHGPSALGPGADGLGCLHVAARNLADRVDVLIHDAQHTAAELPSRATFGHSALEYAVNLGREAGAGTTVLFHHDPNRTDDELDALIGAAGNDAARVIAAHEALVLTI